MREILFRGKRADNGEWVEGFLADYIAGIKASINPEYMGVVDETNFYCVDPYTVGQYTGLTDKNGKRIFEGDILTDPDYPKYTTGAIYYGRTNCSCCDGVYGFYSKENADLRNAGDLTVIGNIYDNPELLGGVSDNG